jgi:integrase
MVVSMPARRRPRGHIETLPSGRYRASVFAGTDPLTGREHRLKQTCDTLSEAQKALTRLQGQVDLNQQPKSSISLAAAIEQWLEVAKLEEITRDRYQDLLRLHIGPRLGHLQAGRLDAELLERYYAQLMRCKHFCGSRPVKGHVCEPLSTSTARKIHYVIRGALGCAVRWKYLGVNVAEMVEAPSPAKTKPDPPSAAEAAALLSEASRDATWGTLIWLVMVTGCRRGELCALRWRDVDFEHSRLWITRSTTHPRSGLKEKDTKSGVDRRLCLDTHTMSLLADHREGTAKQLADLGMELTAETFILSTTPDHSRLWLPRSVTTKYRRMAMRLKLCSIRLHSLRHYAATELIAAGVDLRTVAGKLGHGRGGATTLKVYAAWVEQADRKAADTMAAITPRPVPLAPRPRGPYQSIAEDFREEIRSGRLRPGCQLPTVVQIAGQYTVAAGTAHPAMALLRQEGLIEVTRAGAPSFSNSHKPLARWGRSESAEHDQQRIRLSGWTWRTMWGATIAWSHDVVSRFSYALSVLTLTLRGLTTSPAPSFWRLRLTG